MTDASAQAIPASIARQKWRDRIVLASVALVGCALSLVAGNLLTEKRALRDRESRVAAAQSVVSAFDLELTRTIETVRGTALMVESHTSLHREQFNRYLESVAVHLHSIHIVEWQPIVPAAELQQFEAAARASGMPDYRVVQPDSTGKGWEPVHGRSEYVPVLYAWPERMRTSGYDMSFSPERMQSKLEARRVGQPVASGVFELMKQGLVASGSMGVAISAPVYRPDRSIRGYLAAVIDLPTLFHEASLRADATELDVLVYDVHASDHKPIYTWLGETSDLTPALTVGRPTTPQDQASTVDLANQAWKIVLHPRPSFDQKSQGHLPALIIAMGFAATMLLTMAVARAQRSRRLMEQAQVHTLQARETLAAQRQRLQNIIEAMDVGTWEFNFATDQVEVNERWAAIGGMTHAQWQAIPNYTWKDSCHPDDIPLINDALRRHISGQTSHYEVEYRHRHKDGHSVWVAAKGKVLSRMADGSPEVFAGTLSDITERRAVQARIVELNATLEQRVQERTAELELTMQTLRRSQEDLSKSEARATLGTLVAGVSHEMSTPMGNSMVTASTLSDLARDFEKTINGGPVRRSELTKFVGETRTGSTLLLRNLERAVDLLRNFRQVAADQASEQRRIFDLRQTIQEIVDTLSPSLKNKPHQVVQEVPVDIGMDSYPGPLGQVVINLINNAYLHAFDAATPGRFLIKAESRGDDVSLTFQDNGKGIAPQTLKRMFEPFFSTKIGKGGTGLGMSIVENLVTKTLGGQLTVQSTLGVGTTFVVTLPKSAPQPATSSD